METTMPPLPGLPKVIGLSMCAVYPAKDLNSAGSARMGNNEAKLPRVIA